MAAGQLLARHGITFDVVYTSWLSRAIETAWLTLTEIDGLWIPVHKVSASLQRLPSCHSRYHPGHVTACASQPHKSWRLNERMYGALTGLSKKKTRAKYGEEQVWLTVGM